MLILPVLFVSCPAEKEDMSTFSFSLERTACFGQCPEYRVYSDSTQTVYYHGIANVERIGEYRCVECADMLRAIYARAVSISFWNFDTVYNPGVVDLPSTITHLQMTEKHKRVENLLDAPPSLIAFENYIDSLAESARWQKISR